LHVDGLSEGQTRLGRAGLCVLQYIAKPEQGKRSPVGGRGKSGGRLERTGDRAKAVARGRNRGGGGCGGPHKSTPPSQLYTNSLHMKQQEGRAVEWQRAGLLGAPTLGVRFGMCCAGTPMGMYSESGGAWGWDGPRFGMPIFHFSWKVGVCFLGNRELMREEVSGKRWREMGGGGGYRAHSR